MLHYLLSMTKVPVGSNMTLLESASLSGAPFLYHLMTGLGVPNAWHGRTAIVLIGSVWLAGPMAMIGGGWSSMAVTSR